MHMLNSLHETFVHDRRVKRLCDQVTSLIPKDSSLLDVGCGDGLLSSRIKDVRLDISLRAVDILIWDKTYIQVEQFDGKTLPYSDRSVDAVLFVDVLHHTSDPSILLKEAERVARENIFIKDHLCESEFSYNTLKLMDWIANARRGVNLVYNYWPKKQWYSLFSTLGLKVNYWSTELKLYPFPFNLVFDRSLHFIAQLDIQSDDEIR